MKKSKILVPALAVLALGVAGSAVGTVAWFSATAKLNFVATGPQTLSIQESTIEDQEYSIKVLASSTSEVEYTDAAGNCWIALEDALKPAKVDATKDKVGTISLSLEIKDPNGDDITSDTAKMAALNGHTVVARVQAGNYTRLTTVAPSDSKAPENWTAMFGDATADPSTAVYENYIDVTVSIASGVATLQYTNLYYSVNGQVSNVVHHENDPVPSGNENFDGDGAYGGSISIAEAPSA